MRQRAAEPGERRQKAFRASTVPAQAVATMTGADRAIRYSAIGAVSVVALVAAFVSYRHALQVVRAHGESGALALAYPVSAGGRAG